MMGSFLKDTELARRLDLWSVSLTDIARRGKDAADEEGESPSTVTPASPNDEPEEALDNESCEPDFSPLRKAMVSLLRKAAAGGGITMTSHKGGKPGPPRVLVTPHKAAMYVHPTKYPSA